MGNPLGPPKRHTPQNHRRHGNPRHHNGEGGQLAYGTPLKKKEPPQRTERVNRSVYSPMVILC